ncbi:Methylsterol monooxygenase 1 [Hondaea fermentalgiana]|uniref:Methylsterol monooxygenase 1 n=1 Tax=Hondaea fermentalgiana TaxID=2315210 RepID=A0A2R5GWW0_9STRA|nr:Methylsterol monooxygenase 1 [Hondaea fermentalgiana]|eukprot:GBG34819.1 Methylsterol monooxygenase 1 [Hondaea fermentalgiana]
MAINVEAIMNGTEAALEMANQVIYASDKTVWNPLGLELNVFVAFVLFKSTAIVLLDPVVLGLCWLFGAKKLPSREPVPIMKGLEALEPKDYFFLVFNQIIESIGALYMFDAALSAPYIERDMSKITLGNTVGFVYLIFIIDDFMYYFAHRIMHHPAFYAWCHKHHHRQSMPVRGYFDAANEHPIEQVIGLVLATSSIHMAAYLSPMGGHAVGVPLFLVIYAVMALLNHTKYDVQFGFLGLGYSVRAHEMHHRFPQCNYAQNTMIWDQILGTFKPYRGNERAKTK